MLLLHMPQANRFALFRTLVISGLAGQKNSKAVESPRGDFFVRGLITAGRALRAAKFHCLGLGDKLHPFPAVQMRRTPCRELHTPSGVNQGILTSALQDTNS